MKAKMQKARRYMSDETFAELEESLEQAVAYTRGEREGFRVTRLPAPPPDRSRHQIVQLRKRLHLSQSMFARLLNVDVKTIQAWEQGLRQPSDAALKLLAVADHHPEALLDS